MAAQAGQKQHIAHSTQVTTLAVCCKLLAGNTREGLPPMHRAAGWHRSRILPLLVRV